MIAKNFPPPKPISQARHLLNPNLKRNASLGPTPDSRMRSCGTQRCQESPSLLCRFIGSGVRGFRTRRSALGAQVLGRRCRSRGLACALQLVIELHLVQGQVVPQAQGLGIRCRAQETDLHPPARSRTASGPRAGRSAGCCWCRPTP